MKYISTKDKNEKVTFKEAVIKGLAKNKALYLPENIPVLPELFFQTGPRFVVEMRY